MRSLLQHIARCLGPVRVAVVGGRDFQPLQLVWDFVQALPQDATVVSGGAQGVDSAAEEAAKISDLKVVTFLPDWNKHGKRAGYLRNVQIVQAADVVVAFWDGASKGTKLSLDIGLKAKKPVLVVSPEGDVLEYTEASK